VKTDEAVESGLVDAVAEPSALLNAAIAMAKDLASGVRNPLFQGSVG
jgi:enoyl-CoA hydratase/carnithine racemase